MTGPEHYREAERYLRTAREVMAEAAAASRVELALTVVAPAIAAAQAHATLALAAATAAPFVRSDDWIVDGDAWAAVLT